VTVRPITISLATNGNGAEVFFDGLSFLTEIGADVQQRPGRSSTFEGTLLVDSVEEGEGSDHLGGYRSLSLIINDESGPLLNQTFRAYHTGLAESAIIAETTAIRDMSGTSVADSYFHTTFNSPVFRLTQGLNYLTFTWGLTQPEKNGINGYFPDAVIASSLEDLPDQLRQSDFSPNMDLHLSPEKPFAPLVAFDGEGRTMVASPVDHLLISPMRLFDTPAGLAVGRGFHGAVDHIPAGAKTSTVLVFGVGMVDTVLTWGRLLTAMRGGRSKTPRGPEIGSLGFWNCYGGYYAQLFRPTTAETLTDLAAYFKESDIPVQYFGLDLWYPHETVGFSQSYRPDPNKYPAGLEPVTRATDLPMLLHMSAFDRDNEYIGPYGLTVGENAAYPTDSNIYQDLARDFRGWGACGIWHDFLRTQLENCHSLRSSIGEADRYFDGLVRGMSGEDLDVMLCMPTIGHYLASTAYDNVVAVRTSIDYVNHQAGQAEMLSHQTEYQSIFPAGRNLRQNLFLSFLAGALGLAPSHDVFITNKDHPEGFADAKAEEEALARALSAGIVGFGDKIGHVDKEIVGKLAFPDGRLAQPDHPPYPLVETMQSSVPTFYATTTINGFTWTYVSVWNVSEESQEYSVDLGPLLKDGDLVYDFTAESVVTEILLSGHAEPGLARYLVLAPSVGAVHPLGFEGKYVPVSHAQVREVEAQAGKTTIQFDLPDGSKYSFAAIGRPPLNATGLGLEIQGLRSNGETTLVDFLVTHRTCSLVLEI